MPKLSLKKVFEAAAADPKRKFFALEMFEDGGDLGPAMGEAEVDVPEAMSVDDQLREAFKSLILAVLDDKSLSLEEMGDKIVALLTVQSDAEAALTGGSGGSGGAGEGSGSGSGDGSGSSSAAAESLAQSGSGEGSGSGSGSASVAAATPDRTGAVLESISLLGAAEGGPIFPTATVLEAMAALPSQERRKAFVAEMASNRAAAGGGATGGQQTPAPGAPGSATVPRSAAMPAGATGSVSESAAPPSVAQKYSESGAFTKAVRGGA